MDAPTSTAGVSGDRAEVEAANAFGDCFNGQITAGGKASRSPVKSLRKRVAGFE